MKIAALATAAAASAAVLLTGTPPASAAGPIAFAYGECDSAGGGRFYCFVDWNGGTSPFTMSWSSSNGYAGVESSSSYDNPAYSDHEYGVVSSGYCSIGHTSRITLIVRDAAGQQAQIAPLLSCTSQSQL